MLYELIRACGLLVTSLIFRNAKFNGRIFYGKIIIRARLDLSDGVCSVSTTGKEDAEHLLIVYKHI